MLYPINVADKLGFIEIKEILRAECISPMGKSLVDKIQFITRFDLLDKLLRQTTEFKDLLQNDSPFPASNYLDFSYHIQKMKPEGSFLTEEELHQLQLVLSTVFQTIKYFKDRSDRYSNLQLLFAGLSIEDKILKEIDRILDPKGKIRTNASKTLQDLSGKIATAEKDSANRMDALFKMAQKEGWTGDGSLTIREGRVVVPILAEYKRKFKGYIHDESSTGQTVFIEPAEVFELNNKLRDLEFEKRREIVRILVEITNQIRPYSPLLQSYHGLLTKLDFIRAKAKLAIKLDAEMPILKNEPSLKLINAKHPLLYLSHKESGLPVVPLNINIDENHRVILVSGPNAGGKSVCLKTVGLLQLMLQSGLLIPASEFSEMGFFKKILVDIGDDQSIESDLSTYSAHLTKMKEFVQQATTHTLVLIDEFGTGTDPQFGGPIAEAVLEVLNKKSVKGVITTHYSNLKLFANVTAGISNASMLFDNVEMKPLYQLEVGKPGSSYALEIAQKIGLPGDVLKLAKQKIGHVQKNVDTLLIDLERDKKLILDEKLAIQKDKSLLEKRLAETNELQQFLEDNRKKLLKEAKDEAKNILLNANKLIENTISEIKTVKADKEKTKTIREKVSEQLQNLQEIPINLPKSAEKAIEPELQAGDLVSITDSDARAQIISITKGNAVIALGDIRSVVKLNRLTKISKTEEKKIAKASISGYQTSQAMSFSQELDLRGKRGEEAIAELEKQLDKALMLGYNSIRIVHGKGDGILRKLVRQYLKKYTAVGNIEDEHADRGGDGVTIVTLV